MRFSPMTFAPNDEMLMVTFCQQRWEGGNAAQLRCSVARGRARRAYDRSQAALLDERPFRRGPGQRNTQARMDWWRGSDGKKQHSWNHPWPSEAISLSAGYRRSNRKDSARAWCGAAPQQADAEVPKRAQETLSN